MKAKKFSARLLSLLLAIAMVAALVPAGLAFADSGDTTGKSGLELSKTATLEDDGTYTIKLEAYATGTTTTVTEKSGTPLDIVLVIDQSGSMAYNDDGNSTRTEADRRMAKLKEAVNSFVDNISANAKEYEVDHRIALVGYASNKSAGQSSGISGIGYNGSGSYWVNTGLYVNGSFKNYQTASGNNRYPTFTDLSDQDYKNALVSVNDANGNVASSITTSINNFKASGGTYTEYGMTMAKNIFDNNPIEAGSNRKRIVVLFTDGETNSDINTVLTTANTLKGSAYNATIYSVGFATSNNAENFLSHVSSNYTTASYYSDWWGNSEYRGTHVADKYSMTASNREELNNIFNNISQDIQNPTTEVSFTSDAVLKDIISDEFELPDDFDPKDTNSIEIKTVAGTIGDEEGAEIVWGEETSTSAGVTASVDGKTISVTGFDYKDKYIAPGHDGEKLVVTIKGVLPTDAAATGEAVNTNDGASGVYASSEAESGAYFPQPKTIITSKAYVLDYAKPFTMAPATDWKQTAGRAEVELYGSFAKSTLELKYGALGSQDWSYTPKTTNWNGYDTFYAFGKTDDDTVKAVSANANGNLWSKVSVIPANNVYYEDDFITDGSTGTVGIVYDGTWTTVGTTDNNTETPNGDVHGCEDSLADDTGYSDGSAHVSSTSGATATFTFTGTGVDIYSRTNDETGTIYATIAKTVDGTTTTKRYVVDNKAKSGDYYQIPTLTFSGEYGTYDVTIRVTTGAASEGRYTYYLDGIRVYNPIQNKEDDQVVKDAYDGEIGATFTEIRALLDETSGAAFVDEGADGNTVSKNYKDADIAAYAPEHEVYLAAGQAITFKVDEDGNYYVGLKAPNGETSVAFSADENAAETSIAHSTDLYYKVSAGEDKTIVIKNTGDNLLSITKLRITNGGAVGASLTGEEAVAAVEAFSARAVVPYDAAPVEEPEETVAPAEPETPDQPGDVVIENPVEPEEPSNPSAGDTDSWLEKLFGTIRGWFRP